MSKTRASIHSHIAIALLALSCNSSSDAPPRSPASETTPPASESTEQSNESPAPPSDSEPTEQTTTSRRAAPEEEISLMESHFQQAELIRQAIIAGYPEDTGRPANALIHINDSEEIPEAWNPFVERMQETAKRVADSSDVPRAAAAAADIGTSCGLCHQKHGGPQITVSEAPALDESLQSRMAQHAWATERLWEGLYVPSAPAWAAGAQVLTRSPFPDEVLERGGVYARTAAEDFGKLVQQAPQQKNLSQRAALYAKLLGTCASCHLAVR